MGAALRAAVALALTASPVLAQASGPNTGAISLTGSLDFVNAYLFRGIPQDDTEVIMWPAIDAGVALSPKVKVNVGLWNSLHTGAVGLDGPTGKLWYESDFYGSLTYTTGGLSVGAIYTGYTSPNNAFASVQEIAFKASHGAWGKPYALVAFELEGQADAGLGKGRYLELGGAPSWGSSVTLAVPVKVGLSLGDYYESFTRDETFGFFSVAGTLTKTISSGGSFGSWNVHGGAEYMLLGDRNAVVLGSDSKVVGSVGIGFSY
jgi:hypothetical protein